MTVLPVACGQWRHGCYWQRPQQLRDKEERSGASQPQPVSVPWWGWWWAGELSQGLKWESTVSLLQPPNPFWKGQHSTPKARAPDEKGPAQFFLQQGCLLPQV